MVSLIGCLNLVFMLSYITSASFKKPLSADEEKRLFEAYKKGCEDAKNILVEHNLRLVAYIAKKYSAAADNEDLISIGVIGLIKAVSSFDAEKSAKLSTYAARCIENEILMYLRKIKKHNADISLSEPIGDDAEGNELTMLDILKADDESIVDNIYLKTTIKRLYESLAEKLQFRERLIIALRYGLFGKKEQTQREIADGLGISRSYVSRIEKKALQKLKQSLENK